MGTRIKDVDNSIFDIGTGIAIALAIVLCMALIYTIWDYWRQRDAFLGVLQTYYSGTPPPASGVDGNRIIKLLGIYQQYLPKDLVLPDSCLDNAPQAVNIAIQAVFTNFSHYYWSLGVPPVHKVILNLLALDILANTLRTVQTWYWDASTSQVTWLNNGTWTVDALALQLLNPIALSKTLLAGGFNSYNSKSQCWTSGDPIVPSTPAIRKLQFGYDPLDKFYRVPGSSFGQAQQVGYTNDRTLDELDCADMCYGNQCDMYKWSGDTGECTLLSYYSGDSTSGLRTGSGMVQQGQWEIYSPTTIQVMDSATTDAACASACADHPDGCDQYTFILAPPTCNVRVQNDSDMKRVSQSYTPDSYTCAQQCLDNPDCDGFLYSQNLCYNMQFQQHALTTLGVKK